MCLITVLPNLRPGPEPRPVRQRRERMNSLTDLREVVDVVIGVDTHVHTHSAAAVDTGTGGVLDEITVEATAEGYAELVEFGGQPRDVAGLGDRGDRRSRRRSESSPAGVIGACHRVGPPERAAGRN